MSGEPSSVSGPHKQSSLQGREKEGGMVQIREDTDERSGERERETQRGFQIICDVSMHSSVAKGY